MGIIKNLHNAIKSTPSYIDSGLLSLFGINKGTDYHKEIVQCLYDARLLQNARLKSDQVLILEALERDNMLLSFGITSKDKLREILTNWAVLEKKSHKKGEMVKNDKR